MRFLIKLLFKIISVLLCLAVLFITASVIGALWTSGAETLKQAGANTTTIFISSNGFHSDIVIPYDETNSPKNLPIKRDDFPDKLEGAKYLIIGWGSETAYTSLLELTDMSFNILVKSLLFDKSVMHVQPYNGEITNPAIQKLHLTPDQINSLYDYIGQTFMRKADGTAELIPNTSHGNGDVFYRSPWRYHMFFSCNNWVGAALRATDIKMGIWTPFAQSLDWSLLQNESDI